MLKKCTFCSETAILPYYEVTVIENRSKIVIAACEKHKEIMHLHLFYSVAFAEKQHQLKQFMDGIEDLYTKISVKKIGENDGKEEI